ncbi:MAG: AMP-binding protein, partial [Nocardioidaceae bacterium]
MREYSAPLTVEIPTTGNLTDDVVCNASDAPDLVSFSRPVAGEWQDVTAAQFKADVEEVARGLLAAGVQPGDRVAVVSKTRYEWTLFDYAILWVGAATVPVYETSAAEQIGWILADSGAVACVVETTDHAAKVEQVHDGRVDLKHVWVIEDGAVETLAAGGADVDPVELEGRRTAVGPSDLATLIYTSGTTGRPKGCMLTHGNFIFEL